MCMGRSILLAFLVICFLAVLSAQFLGGPENINDLTDPGAIAAATAAVEYLNGQYPPDAKELILIRIINGTEQVINGIRYRLNIEVAEALTCLNDDVTSTIDQCPVDTNSANVWRVEVVTSSGSPTIYTVESAIVLVAAQPTDNMPPLGGQMPIEDLTDPRVMGAACAAVGHITAMSNSVYKSVLVTIANGTQQVVNGDKYDLLIIVALSTTCTRNSQLCTSVDCPIDECTQHLWSVSVVAPPTPLNHTIDYDIISVTPVRHIDGGGGMKMPIQNFSDPHVMGAACAAVDEITAMSNSLYKSVLVIITSGTYQVVAGLRYDLVIEVALSITCTRESDLCTSVECPIDEHSQSKWMVSVVAPPSPSNEMIVYDVISVAPVNSVEETGGAAMNIPHQLFIFAMLATGLFSFAL